MLFLYNTGLQLYVLVVRVFALQNTKARKWWSGRKKAKQDISKWKKTKPKTIWVHAASLGEFEMGKPIFEPLLHASGSENTHLIITFFSPSGYDVAIKRYYKADLITYLPIDTKENAVFFLNHIKPDVAVFVKYEFWYHIISQTAKRHIPIFTVGARFHKEQIFFKWYGQWFVELLKKMDCIFVQREDDVELGVRLGLKNIELGGDPRFKTVMENVENSVEFPHVKQFAERKPTLIAGSCWEAEEEIMLAFMKKHLTEYVYIIAPHEFKESRLKQFESIEGLRSIRYSKLSESNQEKADVLIIDQVGDLAQLYKYADLAFVGGGFGVGLHNILEPLAFDVPTVFGPDDRGFREAQEVIDLKAAMVIIDYRDLERALNKVAAKELQQTAALHAYFQAKLSGTSISDTVKAYLN